MLSKPEEMTSLI